MLQGSRLFVACALISTLVACRGRESRPSPSPLPMPVTLVGEVDDTLERPLAGAVVVVEGTPDSTAETDSSGHFTVTATVPPGTPVVLRATRDGYAPARRTLTPAGQGFTTPRQPFVLEPAEPLDLTGEYTLVLTADDTCGSLPQVARQRTYDASITRNASATSFTIRLSTATSFFDNLGSVWARIALNFVRIPLYRPVDLLDEAPLVELFGDSYVSIWGSGSTDTTQADRVIAAAFDGSIGYCPPRLSRIGEPMCAAPESRCTSKAHRLVLSRR